MKLLIVVDMQNDFIDGTLGSEEAAAVVDRVAEEINIARQAGAEVWFTRDTHTKDYPNTQEGRKLPIAHCLEGSYGWSIADRLPVGAARVFDKSSFGSLELMNAAKALAPQEVELIGLCTDVCVIVNAMLIKAALPEAKVSVKADCCAGVTPKGHENALNAMRMCQIDILE